MDRAPLSLQNKGRSASRAPLPVAGMGLPG
ncbi:Uncharacterised protein [Achromobacter xylosoxidans]|nr:Uncharacterised protein [Achromobacter xylosoxidans]